jgi:phosphoribosylglycinamide formyltransferase 1
MKLGFFASHSGSNMQAIIDACRDGRLAAEPCLVISNNRNSKALKRAEREGIPRFCLNGKTHPGPESLDGEILQTLRSHGIELVILAGYMRKIGPKTLNAYRDRILNIHPALLPKFGGKGMYGIHVHEAVIASGDEETGVTVHIVTREYDEGPIIAQCKVPVLPSDTPESLAQRVLVREHEFFVETLSSIAQGRITFSCNNNAV